MSLIGSFRRKEMDVCRAIVLGQIIFVIAGPDHRRVHSEIARQLRQRRLMFSMPDDHQMYILPLAADLRERLQHELEAAVLRKLADRGDDFRIRREAVPFARVRTVGSELLSIDRRWCEERLPVSNGSGVPQRVAGHADESRTGDERSGERIGTQHAPAVKCARQANVPIGRDRARQPMVIRQMRVHDVEAVMSDQPVESAGTPQEGEWILRLGDDRMREVEPANLRLELVSADVGEVRIHAGLAQRSHLSEGRSGRARPSVAGGDVEDFHYE